MGLAVCGRLGKDRIPRCRPSVHPADSAHHSRTPATPSPPLREVSLDPLGGTNVGWMDDSAEASSRSCGEALTQPMWYVSTYTEHMSSFDGTLELHNTMPSHHLGEEFAERGSRQQMKSSHVASYQELRSRRGLAMLVLFREHAPPMQARQLHASVPRGSCRLGRPSTVPRVPSTGWSSLDAGTVRCCPHGHARCEGF